VVSWIFIGFKGKEKWRLNRYEMGIIWFAGLIRGSIAFALIAKLPDTGKIYIKFLKLSKFI